MFLVRVTVVVPVVVDVVPVLVDTGKVTSTFSASSETVTATSVAAVLTFSIATRGEVVSLVVMRAVAVALLPSESVIVAVTV